MPAKIPEHSITQLCRRVFATFESHGSVVTEQVCDHVVIKFTASDFAVDERDATFVKLSWCESQRELWISHLRVASPFRRRGLGTQLVALSERLAWHLHARSIHVFPLHPAREFWLAAGYRSHTTISRVLTKTAYHQLHRR